MNYPHFVGQCINKARSALRGGMPVCECVCLSWPGFIIKWAPQTNDRSHSRFTSPSQPFPMTSHPSDGIEHSTFVCLYKQSQQILWHSLNFLSAQRSASNSNSNPTLLRSLGLGGLIYFFKVSSTCCELRAARRRQFVCLPCRWKFI